MKKWILIIVIATVLWLLVRHFIEPSPLRLVFAITYGAVLGRGVVFIIYYATRHKNS